MSHSASASASTASTHPKPAPSTTTAPAPSPAVGSSGGSEDVDADLKPYSLSDNQADLAPVQPPKFLREVIDYLRTKESDTHYREYIFAGLRACEALVCARPDDLPEVGLELLSTLLWLGSALSGLVSSAGDGASKAAAANALSAAAAEQADEAKLTEALNAAVAAQDRTEPGLSAEDVEAELKAVSWRHRAMVAVCLECTAVAVPFCCATFWGDNQTVSQRIDVLDLLEDVARHLAALQPSVRMTAGAAASTNASSSKSKPTTATKSSATASAPSSDGKQSASSAKQQSAAAAAAEQLDVVRARVERNTRRWGSLARKTVAPPLTVNRFAEHARLFFFSLVSYQSSSCSPACLVPPSDCLSVCFFVCLLLCPDPWVAALTSRVISE
jgi:hypothetical protein